MCEDPAFCRFTHSPSFPAYPTGLTGQQIFCLDDHKQTSSIILLSQLNVHSSYYKSVKYPPPLLFPAIFFWLLNKRIQCIGGNLHCSCWLEKLQSSSRLHFFLFIAVNVKLQSFWRPPRKLPRPHLFLQVFLGLAPLIFWSLGIIFTSPDT